MDRLRARMVARQLERRDVSDPRVLEAMRRVPREAFVPEDMRRWAFDDCPLPIGRGQTISQPYMVGLMTQALEIEPSDRVLEVGTGCGYQSAVLAELADRVYSIEVVPELAARAEEMLARLGCGENVRFRVGDGWAGWPEESPFDKIIVTCAPPFLPESLVDQLADGGVMVVPLGDPGGSQRLVRIRKHAGQLEEEALAPVRFVPMVRGGEG